MTTRNKQNAALPQYLPQAAYPTRVRRKRLLPWTGGARASCRRPLTPPGFGANKSRGRYLKQAWKEQRRPI